MSLRLTSETSKKIQILRAFAIFAVVAIHTCSLGVVGVFVRPFINFAVALFLGLSGFLTKTDVTFNKVRKRLMRVFIPYTIWSVVYTAVKGTWALFPLHFITGYSCGTFYFIMVYMQLTLLAPLTARLIKSHYRVIGFLVTPIAILVQYILALNGFIIPKPYNEVFFPMWYLFFYVGMLLRYDMEHREGCYLAVAKKRSRMTKVLIPALPISMLLQIAESGFWSWFGAGRFAYSQIRLSSMLTSVIVILIAVQWITSRRHIPFSEKITNLLVYIGDISFGIYFTHMLWVYVLKAVFNTVMQNIFPQSTLMVFCLSLLGIVVVEKVFPKKTCRILGLV